MSSDRGMSLACVCAAAFALMVAASGCKPSTDGIEVTPGGDGSAGGGRGGNGGIRDGGRDAPADMMIRRDASCSTAAPTVMKAMGEACACSNECASGQCVDDVCCSGPCTQSCFACNVPGKAGTCSPIPAGAAPVVPGQCGQEPVSTCGLNGRCDGSGKCQKYADGTVCVAGTCSEDAVVDAKQCSAGVCKPGEKTLCAPFKCDATKGACFATCSGNDQCVGGRSCEDKSCGKKPLGGTCEKDPDCESNFCADGVCCNTACKGMCESCSQTGKMGECGPVPAGNQDPHGLCKDEGVKSCGFAGVCNGKGSCAKYAAGTICNQAACATGMLIPASVCDGTGTCVGGSAINCYPFACTGTACNSGCTTDNGCQSPATCREMSCGPKPNGVACKAGNECASNSCVDGVCCNEACNGICRFCNSPSQPGKCVSVANNVPDPRAAAGITDPAKVCLDQGASSCGTNGLCNGNGGCQKWASGTMCKSESCSTGTNTYTGASSCNGAGECVAPAGRACAPYTCNGGSRCFTSCSMKSQCSGSNSCDAKGSCGLLPNGAVCSSGPQCASGSCAQGVCCSTACSGSCFSCNLPGSAGTCKAVPSGGLDPRGTCTDAGAASCGNDGTCNGSGGCRKYTAGTVCVGASCASGTFRARSTCDGSGTCNPGSTRACDPYRCNSAGTDCHTSCVNNNQCSGVNSCNGGSCGKKADGATCSADNECINAHCVDAGGGDKVCCNTACTGACMSCGLSSSLGKCTAVGNGVADPQGRCMPDLAGCGNDGTCNGQGACRVQAAGKTCGTATCPAGSSMGTRAPVCDGKGACGTPEAISCGKFLCNPDNRSCFTMCTTADQCAAGNACTDINGQMTCGLKDNGVSCSDNAECLSKKCIDKVCCGGVAAAAITCGSCQRCDVTGFRGACHAVPDGTTDSACAGDTTNPCGLTSTCMGGTCAFTAAGTGCGYTCSADGLSRIPQQCNGSGSCSTPASATPCGNNLKCVGSACLMTCTTDADCTGDTSCQAMGSGAGMPRQCRKLLAGEACTNGANAKCASGSCADGVCCNTLCDGPCVRCNIPNVTQPAPTSTFGTCSNDPVECPPKAARGEPCEVTSECMDGLACADGVCCNTSCTGPCTSCNQEGAKGTCTPVRNAPDNDTCAPASAGATCGNLGCNGSGMCNAVPTCPSRCSADSLSVVTYGCHTDGTCQASTGTPMDCGRYLCSGSACLMGCTGDGSGQCEPGNMCAGGACVQMMDPPPPPPDDAGT